MREQDKIIVSVSIANFGQFKIEDLNDFITTQLPSIDIYKFNPTPGTIYAASSDSRWVGEPGVVIAAIALCLQAYSTFIEPHKTEDSNSGIVLRVENNVTINNIWIGDNNKSQSDSSALDSFVSNIKIHPEQTQKILDSLKNSMNWRKR